MVTRRSRRDAWRQTEQGLWTRSLGSRGMRVRLFQKRRNGVYYRAIWRPGEGRTIVSLGTTDRSQADRLGTKLFAALLSGDLPQDGPVRLGELWDRFQRECGEFLDNKPPTRADSAMRAKVLVEYFGEDFDARFFTARDQLNYSRARERGGIRVDDDRLTKAVRRRSVEADLVLLSQILTWASTVPIGQGKRWLERHPLVGIRREREKNPRRAVATWERFTTTRATMQQLAEKARANAEEADAASQSATDVAERTRLLRVRDRFAAERIRWIRLELALVLAEATGRRLGSIRALRWEDFDDNRQRITWRAESDKKGVEWVVPLPAALADELRLFRRKLGAVGGPVFPAEQDATKLMDRPLFDKWLRIAERRAGLEKLQGSLWHAYRRKWASERMHLPMKAVAAAGGWKDTATLLTCYQHADEELLSQVMNEPRKRRERAADA